jgi:dCMP deaminase
MIESVENREAFFEDLEPSGDEIQEAFQTLFGRFPITETLRDEIRSQQTRQEKWDRRFLELAGLVSSWSKDPSTKCGAVVVRPDLSIASVGYNGFPRDTDDADEIYTDRDLKYARVVHAEMNAILSAYEPVRGYTIYTYPAGLGPSCDRCSAHIVQSGIQRVVHFGTNEGGFNDRWKEACERGLQLYKEAGVEVTTYPNG